MPEIITEALFLKFSFYTLILFCVALVCGVVLAIFALFRAPDRLFDSISDLIVRGEGLKIITVIFIVGATVGLAVLGLIDGAIVASILSGITG